jgi:muramoyltetrapeptide carboxypeptidase
MRIGIVAPSCTLDPNIPDRLRTLFGAGGAELVFHPQCFLSQGHFAGPDAARIAALVDYANDPSLDAIWFARGGYGACRVAEAAIAQMGEAARAKRYLGYSDAGFILAGLYRAGFDKVAHGPMPSDLNREGGEVAVRRALDWLTGPVPVAPVVPQVAFNLTVFSQLIGTPLQPDLTGHVLMLEDVGEYMYRIDRSLFHLTANPAIRSVLGLKMGRFSAIPDNDPDFGLDEEAVFRYWSEQSGIALIGHADIGHDVENKVVLFG